MSHLPIPFLLRLAAEGNGVGEPCQSLEYDYCTEVLIPTPNRTGANIVAVGTFSEFTKATGDPTNDEQSDR